MEGVGGVSVVVIVGLGVLGWFLVVCSRASYHCGLQPIIEESRIIFNKKFNQEKQFSNSSCDVSSENGFSVLNNQSYGYS